MTEAIFSERRTRSQLTLPDNIIQKLSQRSPLKDARTALRNHAAGDGEPESQKLEDDSTDDELLLSPGKNKIGMQSTQRSKRSASPHPQDEYSFHSSSPSTRRELKRVRREPVAESGEKGVENAAVARHTLQRTTPGHACNHSEPNMLINRRSARKRSATTSKKPISTVSEGTPPPPNFSPSVSPKKGRAQSVPLFLSTQDIPRIDFRNIPPSPKRSRSPSRSPSKDRELKLRITSGPFPVAKLFTIQDEAPADVDMGEDASSVVEEREMPLVPATALEEQPQAVAVQDATSALPIPSTSSICPQGPAVPATPASESLNNLIPMSPLTPLPETPLPPRQMADSELESRRAGTLGWDMPFFEPIAPLAAPQLAPLAAPAPAPANSRLPRPSAVPPAARASQKATMGPPAAVIAKKSVNTAINRTATKTTAPKKDAFAALMKGSREQKERTEKEKETGMKAKKSVVASSSSKSVDIFASMPKGKEKAVDAEGPKIKMKDKMRKKEKTKESKPVKLVPTSDDEEQEQQERTEAIFMPSPVEHTVTEPESTPAKTLEPVEPSPLVIEDAVMKPPEPPSHEGPELPDSQDATMKDVEVEVQQEGEQSPDVPITATTVSPLLEPQGIEAVPTPEDGAIVQAEETSTVAEQKDEVVNAEQRGNVMEQVPTEPRPPSRSGPSKLPVGKKRQHISVAPANRVTRSVSSKKKDDSPLAPVDGPSRKKAPAPAPVPAKRTASGSIKKTEKKKTVVEQPPAESSVEAPTEIETETPAEDDDLPPGSPMRMSSPAKMVSTPNKNTADTTPTKSRFDKMPTPSPSKIARATSQFSKPAHMSRTWSMDFGNPDKSTSSLSTLSNALEKLRMPPPARPSTSMGFNRDVPGGDEDPGRSQDDVTVGRKSLGIARSDSLKRHATVGAGAFKAIGTTGHGLASSSKAGGKGLTQKPLSMFMASKGKSSTRGGAVMRGTGRTSVLGGKPLSGVGGAARRTISKKTSLPMVVGSPVKGGGADTTMQEYEEDEEVGKAPTMAPSASGDDGDVFMAPAITSTGTLLLEDLEVEVTSAKGKEETALSRSNASRRVSMASHALSQSLSALPPPEPSKPRGMMGPPATPKGVRSTSSSYPSSNKDRGSSSSPPKAEGSGTRSSARLAKAVPKVFAQSKGSDGSSGKKAPEPTPNPAAEALRVLKDCVIFVDVKTDEGDEAGSLFVEMLEGVGAKVLTRVGQTCTHVVYKNGLMSTVTRYRLLRDPKPFVVGIGWVVECVEQRKHIDETNFLVDLEGVNVAGTHKRRRSMLPKLLSNDLHMPMNHDNTEDGDQSMDSQTSFTMDDGLAPLERARKRKNLLAAGGRL